MNYRVSRIFFLFLGLNLVFLGNGFSQIGGQNTYAFLNFTNSARLASLGGNQVSIKDGDLNMVLSNPSILSPDMDQKLVVNYVNYYAGINYAYFSYARNLKTFGTLAAGLHSIDYGTFKETDETGVETGNFRASEYSLNLFWSKEISKSLSVGANVKPVLSVLDHLTSFGLLSDVGMYFSQPGSLFSAGAVVTNIGSQIKPYYAGNYEPVGFDVKVGITQKLAHAPFRVSILADHLQKFDLTYNNSYENSYQPDTSAKKKSKGREFADKIMRHIIIGVEFLPSKNFNINLGFDYQRRKELAVSTRPFLTGFSAGFGIKINRFQFSYARSQYHLAGASNLFSISTNLNDFYKKNKI